ncbi:MAG TPA: hypothetical protein VGL71_13940 [Urbifossiella sp.]|jgi:hypothetical protein
MMIGYKSGLACILAAISPVVAAIAGWLWGIWHGGPSSAQSGLCEGCDYDLTGNLSGTCPECGMAIRDDAERKIEIYHQAPNQPPRENKAPADSDPVTAPHARLPQDAKSADPVAKACDNPPRAFKPFSETKIEIN